MEQTLQSKWSWNAHNKRLAVIRPSASVPGILLALRLALPQPSNMERGRTNGANIGTDLHPPRSGLQPNLDKYNYVAHIL